MRFCGARVRNYIQTMGSKRENKLTIGTNAVGQAEFDRYTQSETGKASACKAFLLTTCDRLSYSKCSIGAQIGLLKRR